MENQNALKLVMLLVLRILETLKLQTFTQ